MSYITPPQTPQTPQTPDSHDSTSSDTSTTPGSTVSLPIITNQLKEIRVISGTLKDGKTTKGLGSAIWSDGRDTFDVKMPDVESSVADSDVTDLGGVGISSPASSESESDTVSGDGDNEVEMVDVGSDSSIAESASPRGGPNRAVDKEIATILDLQNEWLGTTQVNATDVVYMQASGYLDQLIAWRESLAQQLSHYPYDPANLIDLSNVELNLGYTDTSVSHAYRALILIEAGLGITKITSLPNLGTHVQSLQHAKLRSKSPIVINDQFESQRLEAYQFLVAGLKGCAANWDGLQEVGKALKLFPQDTKLLELREELKAAFKEEHHKLVEAGCEMKHIKDLTRTGRIYQKVYPWMDENLYWRTPALVREVNKSFNKGNAEVRPVFFGSPEEAAKAAKTVKKEGKDVGPLGIFATRNIKEGEVVLVDHTLLGISDVPSSTLEACDACQASLRMPYFHPREIQIPKCCRKAAYCSKACYDTATNGYHSILCGKDFEWIYESSLCGASGEKGECGSRWRPIMFIRLMSIIIADMRAPGSKIKHPLQHPLIARMAANYPPPEKLTPDSTHQWQYFENVVAPTQILLQLGINIFTSTLYTQDVVQTIYWRLENNANMGSSTLTYDTPSGQTQTAATVNNVNVNPNYLFFNHSCKPNISWHGGAVPDSEICVTWLKNTDGGLEKVGCSAVLCQAGRDIVKGEELKISYVGDPLGLEEGEGPLKGVGREGKRAWMGKWFEDGCGCRVCERENQIARVKARERGEEA